MRLVRAGHQHQELRRRLDRLQIQVWIASFTEELLQKRVVAEQEEESSRLSRMFRSSRHRPWVSRGSPLQIEPRRTLESRRGGD